MIISPTKNSLYSLLEKTRNSLIFNNLIYFTLVLTLALGLSGCVTATVQSVREANTAMGSDESIVVLGRRTRPNADETEKDFVSCVAGGVGSGNSKLPVVSEKEFTDAMFPWFEPRTAPVSTSDLPEILSQPLLAARLADIGLRYLVWIDGSTQRTESGGSLTCSVTAGGAGCFGFLSWENDSNYEASIWDIETGTTAGRVSSEASGTSYMPAVVVPIPIIARVRSSACTSLADQLKVFLRGDT